MDRNSQGQPWGEGAPGSEKAKGLERQSMRNWYLLAGICAVSTVGLLIAVTPVLQDSITSFWPWANTGIVLLVGLGGSILLLVLHLTFQQLKVTRLRHHVQGLQKEVSERQQQDPPRGVWRPPSRSRPATTLTCRQPRSSRPSGRIVAPAAQPSAPRVTSPPCRLSPRSATTPSGCWLSSTSDPASGTWRSKP